MKEIPCGAIQMYRDLEEIVIPENVNYINYEAFMGCTGLKRIYMKSKYLKDNSFLPDDIREQVEIIY